MTREFEFIAMLRELAAHEGARGLADDAAVLRVGGETLVLTHDMMVEGRHWPCDADPADVAWKLVAVNLSDLAAKGARPIALLLGFTLGENDWDRRFAEGLGEVLARYDAPLLGGDTVGRGGGNAPRTLGLTAIGQAATNPVPSRAGAREGDSLYLVGAIGDAMAGHASATAAAYDSKLHSAFHRPVPLLREGSALAPLVHAMMDVSDGLLLDAARMASASGVCVDIDSDAVPMSAAFAHWLKALPAEEAAAMVEARLGWGDDYALLFAAPEHAIFPVPVTRIGRFSALKDEQLLVDGRVVGDDVKRGYTHDG